MRGMYGDKIIGEKERPMGKTAKQAFVATIPVLTGYIVLGFGFGIIMKSGGLGLLWWWVCIYGSATRL